jgi:hypothetical protein
MTVNMEKQPWPRHTEDDGEIHCPACNSTDVEDSGHHVSDAWLEEMGLESVPNYHECDACGNVFLPVDAAEHPLRTLDTAQIV